MKAKVIVLPKRDFSYKLKLVSNDDFLKRFAFFWASALEKTQIRHDLPPRLSRILFSSFLFVDDLFSVCFQERLCISFSRCSSLDICLFTYVFSCSLSRSFHRILPIVVSSQTISRVFIDSLYFFYFLFFLVPFLLVYIYKTDYMMSLTLYTLTSVCVFSVFFFMHFLMGSQGEFV